MQMKFKIKDIRKIIFDENEIFLPDEIISKNSLELLNQKWDILKKRYRNHIKLYFNTVNGDTFTWGAIRDKMVGNQYFEELNINMPFMNDINKLSDKEKEKVCYALDNILYYSKKNEMQDFEDFYRELCYDITGHVIPYN